MGIQFLKNFLSKADDIVPIAYSPGLPPEWADFSGRICVLASQGREGAVARADKLYSCEDAKLVASELNREWPSVKHWAAPATADEIKAHPVQAARLICSISSASRCLMQARRQETGPGTAEAG